MRYEQGASGECSCRARLGIAIVVVALLCSGMAGVGQAATMGPEPASYSPGSTSQVPIVLDLGSEEANRIAFSLQVIPGSGAPALTENLSFVQGAGLPSPSVTPGTTQIAVIWFMPFSPNVTGQVTIGHVNVPIPSGASASDSYTVHMLSAGAGLNSEEIPVSAGPDIVLGGATGAPVITISITLEQIGVDVTPTSWGLGVVESGDVVSTWVSGDEGAFAAENTGNVAEDFTISAGSSSPSGWTPNPGGAGVGQFAICYGIGTDPYTSEPTWTCFGSTPVGMDGPVASGEYLPFDLRFTAPATGTTGDSESFVISLAAAAH